MQIKKLYTVSPSEIMATGKWNEFLKLWDFLNKDGTIKKAKQYLYVNFLQLKDKECITMREEQYQQIFGETIVDVILK